MPLTCPKCGLEQDAGTRCGRCGFLLGRYGAPSDRPPTAPLPPGEVAKPPEAVEAAKPKPGPIRRAFRVVRWAALAVSLVVLFLLLRPATPPQVRTEPQAAARIQEKVEKAERDMAEGGTPRLQFDEAELNAWMQTNLALAAAPPAVPPAGRGERLQQKGEPTLEEVRSSLRDVKINLMGDQIRAYVLFTLYGKDISLQLEGRLVVADGRVRLKPTSGMLGSVPIPSLTLDRAVNRLFDSPKNRESFQLPPEIQDIQVVNGELVVSYKQPPDSP
jgi:hypothetical protein